MDETQKRVRVVKGGKELPKYLVQAQVQAGDSVHCQVAAHVQIFPRFAGQQSIVVKYTESKQQAK